ncbi:hypothetical protein [Sphingomicrobium arenosum]|uniref:hypothetical protein n=1 Tax=Sphingomicrobium arenosum TaxID=2233861 RepID=UPI00224076F9|nr:hypothetical protein [Sphingomicrobium arenosum]
MILAAPLLAALMVAQDDPMGRVGPLEDIYQSYNDCFAATSDGVLNPAALTDLGWREAEQSGGASDGPSFFSHSDRAPLLLVNGSDNGGGICVVMAAFSDVASINQFLSAWGENFPAFEDGQVSFFAEGQPILFRLAGTQDKPRLNLVVGTATETNE